MFYTFLVFFSKKCSIENISTPECASLIFAECLGDKDKAFCEAIGVEIDSFADNYNDSESLKKSWSEAFVGVKKVMSADSFSWNRNSKG